MQSAQLAEEFKKRWDKQDRPDLESFLRGYETILPRDLLGVLLVDQFRCWQAGNPKSVEQYLSLVRDYDSDEQLAIELLDEEIGYLENRDGRVDIILFLDRFDQISDSAKQRIRALSLAGVSTSIGDPSIAKAKPLGAENVPSRLGRFDILRQLGRGTFGVVYLARDTELKREVAIKVPSQQRLELAGGADSFLQEARVVAGLDHAGIVPVYDVGRLDTGECYVVSKYVPGGDLNKLAQSKPLNPIDASKLIAQIAKALHQAHRNGLVHRDIKPGNILIDEHDRPHIIDFGLALKDEEAGRTTALVGTPAYMSPEQARGEGHRVDPRSDIYSLGVVLYELLTGRRPHHADSTKKLLELVKNTEVRPPRQFDDTIARDLDRICLKVLSRRRSDRYSTALDFADELEDYIAEAERHAPQTKANTEQDTDVENTTTGEGNRRQGSSTFDRDDSGNDRASVAIVPKGLRAFDATDADFFLELIPGPRNRNGLPDSVRFWKLRLEETAPEKTFAVGLLYGPSGCGKSSLIKAGVLPRLQRGITAIYVEASSADLETAILRSLQSHFPRLEDSAALSDAVGTLGRTELREGEKLILIIDQFEQWLHSWNGEANALVQALLQCDGGRVQAIVMVRDDFWMAATRFMRELEVRLVEGENSAMVDLFGVRHSRNVLTAFGQAYGGLPERRKDMTESNTAFVRNAIAELAEDGKIVPVRLALFAQMLKRRNWTSTTLYELGGASGVGVAFLDDAFGAQSPPTHRMHADAAKAVLNVLLPGQQANIRGRIRSRERLMEASGYRSGREFDELLHVLDDELRLITPADFAEATDSIIAENLHSARFYQLTHDFLVPSIRDWMNRSRQTSLAGRAEICLEQRAALWIQRSEFRALPSLPEFISITSLTNRRQWTDPQRRMMRSATRSYGALFAFALILLVAVAWVGRESFGHLRARSFRDQLLVAEIGDVPSLIESNRDYERWSRPLLEQSLLTTDVPPRVKRNVAIALLDDAGAGNSDQQLWRLTNEILGSSPDELPVLVEAVRNSSVTVTAAMIPALQSDDQPTRLNAAAAMVMLDEYDDDDFRKVADQIAVDLTESPLTLSSYLPRLAPIGAHLVPGLLKLAASEQVSERNAAAVALNEYYEPSPVELADLIEMATAEQFRIISPLIERSGVELVPTLKQRFYQVRHSPWPVTATSNATIDQSARAEIESVHGILTNDFAFAPWLPINRVDPIGSDLAESGYRPIRLRPFSTEDGVRVAALWIRDSRDCQWAIDLTASELSNRTMEMKKRGLLPRDVAGYFGGAHEERFAAIWESPASKGEQRELYFGKPLLESSRLQDAFANRGFRAFTRHLYTTDSFKELRHSMVWGFDAQHVDEFYFDVFSETEFEITARAYDCPIDVCVTRRSGHETDAYYGAVWVMIDRRFDREVLFGESFIEHRERANELIERGYRPSSVSAAEIDGGGTRIASVWRRPKTKPDAIQSFAAQQANCAAALAKLDQFSEIVAKLSGDCSLALRTELIHVMQSHGCDPADLIAALNERNDPTTRRSLLLALGEYPPASLPSDLRNDLVSRVQLIFRDDPNAGVHSAAEWTLRKWGIAVNLEEIAPKDDREWTLGENGHSWITVDLANQDTPFVMGCYRGEIGAKWLERAHSKWVKRRFAISAHETSVAQFRRFVDETPEAAFALREDDAEDMAQTRVSWYQAAQYCNWLSAKAGISEDQWCYIIEPNSNQGLQFKLAENYLSRAGFRLPSETEWEYCCRANSRTVRAFGDSGRRLGKYAWFVDNSSQQIQPVGLLKPNALGLFDTLGNAGEWCQEMWSSRVSRNNKRNNHDREGVLDVKRTEMRVSKGGTFEDVAAELRSADRTGVHPYVGLETVGFRVVRTLVK